MSKNSEKAAAYDEALMGYVKKGYARKLTQEEVEAAKMNPKTWFLPHHGVSNPNKKKLRVVFDAAASCQGTSLNDNLLTGPDLLQNLVGILIRFREERVAIMGDITEMFHQVKMRVEDQPALTFLWRGGDTSKTPDHYRMLVTIFGARCSPVAASYVLQRTADDHRDDAESAVIVSAIRQSFYMDDFLHSARTVEKAKMIKNGVTEIVGQGGFVLAKWVSSHSEVLEDSEYNSGIPAVDLMRQKGDLERALGCVWIPEMDLIGVKNRFTEVPETKRGVLRRVAMIFDPLGIVAPFTLRAKILVQRLWSLNYGWDDQLRATERHEFLEWESEIHYLENIRIPRCYKARLTQEPDEYQLHVFCDASEAAFGAVAYVRMTNERRGEGEQTALCSFVMAKTRLAPLKQLTIARLELQAAVLACRLAASIKQSITYHLSRTLYWTDSKIVLAYVQHESRRFHTFTANRVAEILDLSSCEDWKHVPGHLNPADACSRGASGATLNDLESWWEGPEFLKKTEEFWPSQGMGSSDLDHADPEVRRTPHILSTQVQTYRSVLPDPARFSSWNKYTRIVAWIKRYIDNLKAAVQKRTLVLTALNGPEIESAKMMILKDAQQRAFSTDIKKIATSGSVHPSSPLLSVSPMLDEQGLLRAGGRLSLAPICEDARHPVILSRKDEVTRMLIQDAHERALHAGVEHTLSMIRSKYWIPRGRATVKHVLYACSFCRNRRAKPSQPKMADLPRHRFDTTRPFHCVGLDFFGPLQVKKFRKTEKRWVLLVTCLSTRAVHLEVVWSLDTDSFLMGMRRFFGRRGKPSVVYSDNGTNIVAGEKEMRTAIKEWNQSQILDELSQEQIEWHFNPPTASHMGGIWERLVASVKRALRVVLGRQVVTDEVLSTALVEVEYVVNSRPITYCSGDADDPEPLTPNHFLLGSPELYLPPGSTDDSALLSKRRWKHAQVIANHFWTRWRKEYLPNLMRREKWALGTGDIEVGDVVMMVDDQAPRGYWPLATVTRTTPSADGHVRSLQLRTGNGLTYQRPANKVCFLERPQEAANQL